MVMVILFQSLKMCTAYIGLYILVVMYPVLFHDKCSTISASYKMYHVFCYKSSVRILCYEMSRSICVTCNVPHVSHDKGRTISDTYGILRRL